MIDPNDPRLTAYVLGELSDAECREIEAALEGSTELQGELETIRRTAALLCEGLAAEPCPELTRGQRAAITEQAREPGTAPGEPAAPAARGHVTSRAVRLALAASLLVVAVGIPAAIALWSVGPGSRYVAVHSKTSGPIKEDQAATVASPTSNYRASSDAAPAMDSKNPDWSFFSGGQPDGMGMQASDEAGEAGMDGMFGPALSGSAPATLPVAPQGANDAYGGMAAGRGYATSEEQLRQAGGMPGAPGMSGPGGGLGGSGGRGLGGGGFGGGIGLDRGDIDASADFMLLDAAEMPAETDRRMIELAEPAGGEPHPFAEAAPESRMPLNSTADNGRPKESTELGRSAAPAARGESADKRRTWVRSRATPNASRLAIGDQDELPLEGMQVNVLVDGFQARVLLDLYYFNDRGQRLEGNFQLRLPNDASLYYFAFGESAYEYRPQVDQLASRDFVSAELVRAAGLDPQGILRAREGSWTSVKEARVVPRAKAAHAYGETVRRRVDPALVEWSGAGVFQARVFPLAPAKLHRIVVGYDVALQQDGNDLLYQLDLPEDVREYLVDLNVAALPGTTAEVIPEARPFTSGGRAYFNFNNPAERRVSVRFKDAGTFLLTSSDESLGHFFATRFAADLPAGDRQAGAAQAVLLVDTSLSSRPDKFNVWLDMLEELLTANRDSIDEFAVLFFNIESHWWREAYTKNTADEVDQLITYCRTLSLEGATDLHAALAEAADPEWLAGTENPPRPDLFLLSDGAVTWGEANVHRLSQDLASAGIPLFAYRTGLAGTATGVLDHLARETGGAVFSVATEQEVAAAATAHRQRPWKLVELAVPNAADVLVAGRPQFVYPGQALLVAGRGFPGKELALRVRRGDEEHTVAVALEHAVTSDLAPRLYGQLAVGQLEDLGANLADVTTAYARHFRVTGQTCSLLMLESEADYQRFDIKPEEDEFLVRSTPAADLITSKLDELAGQLADSKASIVAWLASLENTPGLRFQMPPALRLVIERLPGEAFQVDAPRLVCRQRLEGGTAKEYLKELAGDSPAYAVVSAEAARRFEAQGPADALRTLSSLIETSPGDPVLTRDVAFSAIEWGLPGQAYGLLKRVAQLRPYEPQTYQAMSQCLTETGHADLAMIFYEVALRGQWHSRYQDVHQIVTLEYLNLLRRIERGELTSQATDYARARLASLVEGLPVHRADLVVTMMWNTDRTDIDLHVLEPTGEECYYEHRQTRIGGQMTADVTEGFGPEMYTLPQAVEGEYRIMANYFGSDANRTGVRSKVYVTVYEDFGDAKRERVSRKTVLLSEQKEKRELAVVRIER